ncbi:MAG: ABC transporter substrate-binding protein [Acidobacteriota bacterium]
MNRLATSPAWPPSSRFEDAGARPASSIGAGAVSWTRLILSLVMLSAAALPSCARRPSAPAAAPLDTLTRHLDGDPPSLEPLTTTDELTIRVTEMIFRPLIGLDKTRRFVPSLAASWAASSDGLVYDIRLDPKATWEDGTPVTSQDVAFTIERVRDPRIPAITWRGLFDDLQAVETPDPSTVIVRFSKQYSQRLFAFTLPIVSAAAYRRGTGLDRQPVGSGPYRLESWTPNQKIVLLRRADADPKQIAFQRVVFRVLPDSAVRFRAGSAGELDEFRISRDQRISASKSPEFAKRNRIEKAPQFSVTLLVWNVRNPWLADPRVRLALSHGLDRREMAKRLYPPEGAALVSGPFPAGTPENAPEVPPVSYDPGESARLLDAAGLRLGLDGFRQKAGRRVSLEILYPGAQPMSTSLVEIFTAAAKKLGIEILPRPIDWAAFVQRFSAGEFEIAPNGQQYLPPNVDQFPYVHSSQAPPQGENAGFYRNPSVDRAVEAVRAEPDERRRIELYRQVHRLLAADPPADYLWSTDQYWGLSTRLDGVEVSPIGLFHFLPGPLAWRAIPARR